MYPFLFPLFQALTYRVGHHSTSDDSTKYRPANEIEWWRLARDPVAKFRKWIEGNGWWNGMAESELRNSLRQQVKYPCLKIPGRYWIPKYYIRYIEKSPCQT